MPRTKRMNPLTLNMVRRVIEGHPGDAWTPRDIAIFSGWQIAMDRDNDVPTLKKALTTRIVEKVLVYLHKDDVQQYVDDLRLAAPILKSSRSRNPAWIDGIRGVTRAEYGKAVAAIRAALVERANLMADPVARKSRLDLINRELELYTSTPTERTINLALLHGNVEGATDQIEKERARAAKAETQNENLLASMALTQKLLERWNFEGEAPTTTMPRPSRRPGASAEH